MKLIIDRLRFVGLDRAFSDELFGVDDLYRLLRLNFAVLNGLRECGFVPFVVAVLAVANHVDDDIALELLPVLQRELRQVDRRLGVFPVHMEDRRLDELGQVGAILRRSGVARVRGEADLVVDDDVERAAGSVTRQVGHVQRFGHETLAHERRVAVDQQR